VRFTFVRNPTKKDISTAGEIQIAVCGMLLLLVNWGLVYGMPVLFPTLAQHFGVPMWHLAAFFSISGAIYFGIGGLAGALADRYGAPAVVASGMMIGAGGFLLAGLAGSEIGFAFGYILAASATCGLTYAPVTAAVQVLSTRRKVVTAGITSSGIGFGSMLLPPLLAWSNHTAGHVVTLFAMAGIALLGALPVLALRGVVQHAPAPTQVSALRTNANFRWAFVGQMLFAIMFFVPIAYLVPVILWRGWSATEGVELISLLGLFSTVGRFLVLPFAQRLGVCLTASFCAALTSLSMVGLALAPVHWLLWASVSVFGVTYGAVIALSAPIVSQICGSVDMGRNVGVLMAGRAVGVLVGPWSVALTEYWTGSYTWPLLACALIGLTASLCMERSGGSRLALQSHFPFLNRII
jgi:OFA family oxalate/formate antiporter-like MFS transporter